MFDPPSWGYLSVVCKTGPQIYDPPGYVAPAAYTMARLAGTLHSLARARIFKTCIGRKELLGLPHNHGVRCLRAPPVEDR
jgi:hypothetical protein